MSTLATLLEIHRNRRKFGSTSAKWEKSNGRTTNNQTNETPFKPCLNASKGRGIFLRPTMTFAAVVTKPNSVQIEPPELGEIDGTCIDPALHPFEPARFARRIRADRSEWLWPILGLLYKTIRQPRHRRKSRVFSYEWKLYPFPISLFSLPWSFLKSISKENCQSTRICLYTIFYAGHAVLNFSKEVLPKSKPPPEHEIQYLIPQRFQPTRAYQPVVSRHRPSSNNTLYLRLCKGRSLPSLCNRKSLPPMASW